MTDLMSEQITDELVVTDERGIQTLHPAATERLHQYWVHGKGAAQIDWGSPGDFARCTALLEEHAHFSPEQAHGYCNLAHKSATGMYPATHAKLLGKHRSEEQIHMPTREDLIRAVTFADPGYQDDGTPRYPIESAAHAAASWRAINEDDVSTYTAEELAAIRAAIRAAADRYDNRAADPLELEVRQILRYNDVHAPAGSPTGGQFSSGGSSSSSAKKQTVKKAPAKHATSHGTPQGTSHAKPHSSGGTLAFDGHRGPGYGMKNGDPTVHKVQDDLVRLGFAKKGDKALSDGKYGPKTSAAVKKAQKALGLKADGIATPALIAKLAATKSLPHRSAGLDLCVRSFGFELEVRGDGRTLEGYAAVFNAPTTIRDLGGDFEETILPGAFSRSLKSRMPILQWDHGKDPRVGTVPIGSIQHLGEDTRGLHVTARLFDNPVVEPVRQAIEAKAVKGMSFRFGVPAGGDEWPTRDKRNVRDADVHELGPVAFPAYDATSVSVRSLLAQLDAAEIRSLVHELADQLGMAVDLTDLVGQSVARSADGDEHGPVPSQSPEELRLQEQALRALGVL